MDLRSHLKTAAVALVTACFLWLVVHNEEKVPHSITVPIVYGHPPEVILLGGPPKAVELRVLVTRQRLRTLSPADFTVRLNHRSATRGDRTEVLTPSDVDAPFGVVVEDVVPAQIHLTYDLRVTRQVPVRVEWRGEPADGWQVLVEELRSEPALARVVGPSTLLEGITELRTRAVDVAGAQQTIVRRGLALLPPEPGLTLVEPIEVTATVPLAARQETRLFSEVPVELVHGEWASSPPNPARLDVTVSGPAPTLRKLEPSAVRLLVDLRSLKPQAADHRVEVEARVDQGRCAGCTITGLAPQQKVDVMIRERRREQGGEAPAAGEAAAPDATETRGTERQSRQGRAGGRARSDRTG